MHAYVHNNIWKELYNSPSKGALLKTIGVSQMEKELEGQIKSLEG